MWNLAKPDPAIPAGIIYTVYTGSGTDSQKRNSSQETWLTEDFVSTEIRSDRHKIIFQI